MAERLDHKCIVCGAMYHACDTCQKIKTYTPWRTLCDTMEHYQVLLAIKSYDSGVFTKEEAAEDIKKRGVVFGSYDEWPEGTKHKLNEILAEPKRKKKNQSQNEVIHEAVEEPIETSQDEIIGDIQDSEEI